MRPLLVGTGPVSPRDVHPRDPQWGRLTSIRDDRLNVSNAQTAVIPGEARAQIDLCRTLAIVVDTKIFETRDNVPKKPSLE
jgi:hypothetical protein